MKKVCIFLTVLAFGISLSPGVFAIDPSPAQPEAKPIPIEEEKEGPQPEEGSSVKTEQHAPTLDIGDTKKFMRKNPLSEAKDEEEFEFY